MKTHVVLARGVSALVLVASSAVAAPGAPAPDGDYRRHPVFYEAFPDRSPSRRGDSLELLRQGIVQLQHYPPVDVSNYNWEPDSFTDFTWRMQSQELRFLLPAIASTEEGERRLAWEWFLRWYAVHMVPGPATQSWGPPITVGYRTLVFVYLLKTEEARKVHDEAVLVSLRESILAQQRFLALETSTEQTSNHGFIAALGLFESTRVFADPKLTALALERVLALMDRLVSPAGLEREHSPAYHFIVARWLDQISAYAASLPSGDREFVARTRAGVDRMRRAGYFLQDHAGLVTAIGDTDSMTVDELSPGFRVLNAGEQALFDSDSGYGIFKGAIEMSDCRYVVFRIPGGDRLLRRHLHMDALSVFFAYAGETILGDTGRYSYASGAVRAHCLSPSAHNTLLPSPDLYSAGTTRLVDRAADRSAGDKTVWAASMTLAGSTCRRTVTIPAEPGAFTVVDSIMPAQSGAHDAGDLVMLWNTGIDVVAVERLHDVRAGNAAWRLTTRTGKSVAVTVSSSGPAGAGILDVREASGEEAPRLGWYSPVQFVLRPVTTLVIRVRRAPGVVVTTRVEVSGADCGPASERRAR